VQVWQKPHPTSARMAATSVALTRSGMDAISLRWTTMAMESQSTTSSNASHLICGVSERHLDHARGAATGCTAAP
jgi:hypothetical protein